MRLPIVRTLEERTYYMVMLYVLQRVDFVLRLKSYILIIGGHDSRLCVIEYRMWKCGGSIVAHQTSGAEVPGSNTASSTMILMRCRIIVHNIENLRVERDTYP